jgi:hypothetical protein
MGKSHKQGGIPRPSIFSVTHWDSLRTAAIRFSNGTAIDIAMINGSPSYIAAMKELAEDAVKVRAGEESSLLVQPCFTPVV